jgi:hypothetical protein
MYLLKLHKQLEMQFRKDRRAFLHPCRVKPGEMALAPPVGPLINVGSISARGILYMRLELLDMRCVTYIDPGVSYGTGTASRSATATGTTDAGGAGSHDAR